VPKYLIEASYTTEGAKGLLKDGGSKRRQAATAALKSVGAKVEAFYFAFGGTDVYLIIDAPDNVAVSAASLAISATGSVRTKTVVLLTADEIDEATKKVVKYRAPGE
jgi:uncharacterized protein with GYD domain